MRQVGTTWGRTPGTGSALPARRAAASARALVDPLLRINVGGREGPLTGLLSFTWAALQASRLVWWRVGFLQGIHLAWRVMGFSNCWYLGL